MGRLNRLLIAFVGPPVGKKQNDLHNRLLNESGEMAPVCSGALAGAGIERAHIELPGEETILQTILQNGSRMVNGSWHLHTIVRSVADSRG